MLTDKWYDIVKEKSRTYIFAGDERFTIEAVVALKVSSHGTHYLGTASGQKVIVRCGWLAILIDAKEWTVN